MRYIKFSLAAAMLMTSSLQADLNSEKITLKNSMQVDYTKTPASVDSFSEAFTEGEFYGRLRANAFYYDWPSKLDDKVMGIGGSLVYKTAPLNGFSATVAGYTTQNPVWMRPDESDVGVTKSGKDTFSRYNVATEGDFGMSVLGQAYLQYDKAKTSVQVGRLLYESVFTASNDTKMIPNTFDGVTATSNDFDNTTISVAYLAKQKLRDHTTSHDVLAVNGWVENDDSAVNKNLTVANIGDNNKLIIASVTNKSIPNLKANVSYAIVPDVLSNLVLEANYGIKVSDKWTITPGVRYMQQFDNLGANYAVANLKGSDTTGYSNPNSLDSYMIASRVDFKSGAFLGRVGYSYIADKADIVTPWRGFPTGGYTRAMAMYNWNANTKSYMVQAGYDFGKAGMLDGFSLMARYAIQDFDDAKVDVNSDNDILHIDAIQNLTKDLQLKVRMGFCNADANTVDMNGATKTDWSYNEYRVELNYFF